MLKFDEVGIWSEIKLEILRKYAAAYSTILASRETPAFEHFYIDGFSGAGTHVSKERGEQIAGSPQIALEIKPPFRRFIFVDLDGDKVVYLRSTVGGHPNVTILHGDSNRILLDEVFPQVSYEKYQRALCLLDPYGLDLNWEVIRAAGESHAIELFLNFPVMDINRNTLWHEHEKVPSEMRERLTAFWGDETWFDEAYEVDPQARLFGDEEERLKRTNEQVAEAFRQRLRQVAGFSYVPRPLPMRNSRGAVVYYLYFASQKPVAARIVDEIFEQYRNPR